MSEQAEGDLIRSAEAAGLAVSRDQLKRFRRGGLLPRPSQEHREGVRGSISTYPDGTDALLIEVLRLHQGERRLDALLFKAWWRGLEVQEAAIRALLVNELKLDAAALPSVSADRDFEWVEQVVRWAATSRHPLIRFVRGNLRHTPARDDQIVTVVTTVLEEASTDIHEVDDEDVVNLASKGIGLTALTEPIGDLGALVDEPPDLRQSLRPFAPHKVLGDLETVSYDQLRSARDDARFLAYDLTTFALAAKVLFGRSLFGLKMLIPAARDDARGWELRRILVCACTRMRGIGLGDRLDDFKQLIREEVPKAEAFLQRHRQ